MDIKLKKYNKKTRIIVLLFLPSLLFLTSFFKEDEGLKIGSKIPMMNTKMKATDDASYALQDMQQENGMVIIFSCNTCPFVVGNDNFEGWEKQYNDLYDAATEAKMGFILVNSNEAKRSGDDSMEAMKTHATENGYKMTYVVDEDSKLADAFGAKTTPHLYVVDGTGKLVYKGSIDNSWDTNRSEDRHYFSEVIDFLVNGTTLKDETTAPRGCSIKRN